MKTEENSTPLVFKRDGVCIRIRPTTKSGAKYFVCDYRVKGRRKLVWRSTLSEARQVAGDAVDKIIAGQAEVLELTSTDRHIYLRACEALATINTPLDQIAREYAEAVQILAGRATLMEVCRDWQRRHDTRLPSKTVEEATDDCIAMATADNKSHERIRQLKGVFNRFKADLNVQVAEVTPAMVSQWLTGLKLGERSRRNFRDTIGFLCRFCVLRGYLSKGTDWLENVQNYSIRKMGEIEIYTPDELASLIKNAEIDMVPFVVIQAFAGLRHAEVARLDWKEVDLDDGFIEVLATKSKTGERRLVPIQANLKAWLLPRRESRGRVCPYANTTKQLLKTAAAAQVVWKHNGLRHSAISYRVAQCAALPRVADESGNSVAVIRGNYLQRVTPSQATQWFAIRPETIAKK